MAPGERLQGLILVGIGLGIPVVVVGSFFTDVRILGAIFAPLGYVAFAVGCLFGVLNFYLSWVRPFVHWLRSDGTDFRRISGVPLLGNVAVVGLLFAPPSIALSTAALVQIASDTGGLQYLVGPVWKEIVAPVPNQ